MKSNGSTGGNESFSSTWNARCSLNLLKMSLNCPTLPPIKDDTDAEIDESDVETPYIQEGGPLPCEDRSSAKLSTTKEDLCSCIYDIGTSSGGHTDGEKNAVGEVQMDNEFVSPVCNNIHCASNPSAGKEEVRMCEETNSSSSTSALVSSSNLSIVPCQKPAVPSSPKLSRSAVTESYSRKTLRTSSSMSASQKLMQDSKLRSYPLSTCFSQPSKTESLAASLDRGLEIIDNRQYSAGVRRSSFRFSVSLADLKPAIPINKFDAGIQTLIHDSEKQEGLDTCICSLCKKICSEDESEDANNGTDLQLVPINGPVSVSTEKVKLKVLRAVENVLAGSIRREMALEEHCVKQASEIMQLNRLLQQYKHERECTALIAETREDKISRLENLMDGILPAEDFMEEEFVSPKNEHMWLPTPPQS